MLTWVERSSFDRSYFSFLLPTRSRGSERFPLSAAQAEDVVNWVVVPVEMFSGWHDWSRNHILPLGTNKQGLRGNDVASDRPEGGSNKFKLHPSSTINWPFSLLKGCHIAPGYVFTKLSVFATFQIDCRLLINWPAAIILTQLWRFQFWLFIHFIFVVPTKKCAARAEAQMTDRASQSALPKLQF